MPRFSVSILATIAATISVAVLVFVVSGRIGDERTDAQQGHLPQSARSMPGAKVGLEAETAGTSAAGGEPARRKTNRDLGCPRRHEDEMRVGNFEHPKNVPEYEILQKSENERNGICVKRLLVDTQATSEADLTLITRDLKARYASFDAVSIEFTDSTDTLSYTGGAVIFNTTEGAVYIGYIYGPPNNEGFIARAAE